MRALEYRVGPRGESQITNEHLDDPLHPEPIRTDA